MTKVLFVGTYLSQSVGSKGVSESIAERLYEHNIECILVSNFTNKVLRILDIIIKCLFFRGKIIHIDVFSGQAFIIAEVASFVSRLRKKSIILSLHGGNLTNFSGKNQERIRSVFARAERIQTPSLFLKHYYNSLGFNQILYVPNGLQLSNFPYKKDREKKYKLLWVRAFNSIYNPALAVEILWQVKKTLPSTTLTMIGPDNGLLGEVQSLIIALQLTDSVTITGPIPNNNLCSFYQNHNLFLNTTSLESFGVAVLEAASSGIPIVSTNVGELPFLWTHNEDVILVNTFNPVDFSKEVIRVLMDDSLSNQLSQSAREKSQNYDWSKIIPTWIDALKNKL